MIETIPDFLRQLQATLVESFKETQAIKGLNIYTELDTHSVSPTLPCITISFPNINYHQKLKAQLDFQLSINVFVPSGRLEELLRVCEPNGESSIVEIIEQNYRFVDVLSANISYESRDDDSEYVARFLVAGNLTLESPEEE